MMQTDTPKDGRRLTGYNTSLNHQVHHSQQQQQQQQHHSLYDDDMEDHRHYYYDEDDDDEDDEEEVHEEEDDDDAGSVLSIPDPNINFDLVYALHTFAATVDGQASVVKGDALTLLDDSNSYWWLVKVLKTSEVGYIPAENIETPYERLARLNSHRNIELTRRDIQDAFPAPPSMKAKATKRVTLAKGVKFQAQVIFGGDNDDDDFEEEYEEWDEALLSSDSDDSSSDSDDYDYYSSHLSGNGHPNTNNNLASSSNNGQVDYQQSQMSSGINAKAAHVPPIVTQSLDRRQSDHSLDSPLSSLSNSRPGPRDTLDLEQSETIKISLTPSIARGGGEADDGYGYNRPQNHQKKTMNKLERLLGEDDPLTSPTSPRNSGGSSGKKSSIRKFFSRGSKDSGSSGKRKDSKTSSLGADSILSETASVSSQSTTSYSERDRSGSLDSAMLLQTQGSDHLTTTTAMSANSDQSRYYTPTDGPNSVMASPTSPSSLMSPSSFTSSSMPFDHHPPPHPLHQQQPERPHQQPVEQPVVLMVHGGNLAFGDDAKPALAYTSTTAMEMIQQVVDKLDPEASEPIEDRATNYYLVVKGVDGDEYTLVPSDRPLSIYHSLTGHLNTPMPSLKKARRISQLMSTAADSSTHIGGPSYNQASSPTSPGADSAVVRFYLHSKKRATHEDGVIRIKVSLLKSEMIDQEELFGPGQGRVDKSLFVPHTGSVGDVAALILERFHLLNGVVDGASDLDDQIKALRLDGGVEGQAVLYRLNVFRNGREFVLNVNDPIINAYEGQVMPTIHHSRGSNPDRSSIASMSSVIHSPQADETFFILRRVHHRPQHHSDSVAEQHSSSHPPQRPARSHRPPVRQNTPMPHTKSMDDPGAIPPMHPLQMNTNRHDYSEDRSASPLDMATPEETSRSYSPHVPYPQPHYRDTNKEQVTPEDGDVLMQLDAALDSLAHTRNSNEPLTEAITHHQQRSVAAPSHVRDPSPLSMSSVDPLRSRLDDPPPSTTSTISTVATSISAPSPSTLTPTDMTADDKKPSLRRRTSIQSMLYWDDFGMEDLMIMIRGSAKCQEAMEKKEAEKKNRRSSRHYTAPIRSEINEVFKDSHVQLEQLEKELDMLMAQAVKTYCC